MINNVNGSLKDLPIEMLETRYPFRINEYSIRPNSGGPGQYRGGNGVVREYEFLADCVGRALVRTVKDPRLGAVRRLGRPRPRSCDQPRPPR